MPATKPWFTFRPVQVGPADRAGVCVVGPGHGAGLLLRFQLACILAAASSFLPLAISVAVTGDRGSHRTGQRHRTTHRFEDRCGLHSSLMTVNVGEPERLMVRGGAGCSHRYWFKCPAGILAA